jgi:hypothetical protein
LSLPPVTPCIYILHINIYIIILHIYIYHQLHFDVVGLHIVTGTIRVMQV